MSTKIDPEGREGSRRAPGSRANGRDWTPAALDFPANAEMIGLASRTGALVGAGNGVAWFSQDGTGWTMEALPGATGYVPRAVRTWGGNSQRR